MLSNPIPHICHWLYLLGESLISWAWSRDSLNVLCKYSPVSCLMCLINVPLDPPGRLWYLEGWVWQRLYNSQWSGRFPPVFYNTSLPVSAYWGGGWWVCTLKYWLWVKMADNVPLGASVSPCNVLGWLDFIYHVLHNCFCSDYCELEKPGAMVLYVNQSQHSDKLLGHVAVLHTHPWQM